VLVVDTVVTTQIHMLQTLQEILVVLVVGLVLMKVIHNIQLEQHHHHQQHPHKEVVVDLVDTLVVVAAEQADKVEMQHPQVHMEMDMLEMVELEHCLLSLVSQLIMPVAVAVAHTHLEQHHRVVDLAVLAAVVVVVLVMMDQTAMHTMVMMDQPVSVVEIEEYKTLVEAVEDLQDTRLLAVMVLLVSLF
jgi:hypothetical protein